MGVDFKMLAGRLFDEKEPSIRSALALALGEYPYDVRVNEIGTLVADRLIADTASPDSGLHSAVAWLCTTGPPRMRGAGRIARGKAPEPKQSWFVNKEGQTFAILRDPGVFLMGSPEEETRWAGGNEQQHHRRIPRSFAIGTREVTVAEFLKFLAIRPRRT